MRIAIFTSAYKPKGGVFATFPHLVEFYKRNGIEAKVFCIGKKRENEPNIEFIRLSEVNSLLEYDIIHIFKIWKSDERLFPFLIEACKQKKALFHLHDIKDLESRSKTNLNDTINAVISYSPVFVVHGYSELQFYIGRLSLRDGKVVYVPHVYIHKEGEIGEKNKIVITSRIDYCKGLEWLKDWIKTCKYPLELWSGNKNEAFVYFTKFQEILKLPCYKGGFSGDLDSYNKIYANAKVLINFTYWGKGSGGRTEYTTLEAWNYQCIPFLDKRWVEATGSILKHEYNCIAIDRTAKSYDELEYYLHKVFTDDIYYKTLLVGCQETYKKYLSNIELLSLVKNVKNI